MHIRKLFRLAALALTVIFFAPTAHPATSSGEWSDTTFITAIYPMNERLVFMTEFGDRDLSSCNSGSRFALDPDSPGYKTQVAALLTAFANGMRIRMYIRAGQNVPTCAPVIDRFSVLE